MLPPTTACRIAWDSLPSSSRSGTRPGRWSIATWSRPKECSPASATRSRNNRGLKWRCSHDRHAVPHRRPILGRLRPIHPPQPPSGRTLLPVPHHRRRLRNPVVQHGAGHRMRGVLDAGVPRPVTDREEDKLTDTATRTLTVTVPEAPASGLMPNQASKQAGWYKRSELRREAREVAKYSALGARPSDWRTITGPVRLDIFVGWPKG